MTPRSTKYPRVTSANVFDSLSDNTIVQISPATLYRFMDGTVGLLLEQSTYTLHRVPDRITDQFGKHNSDTITVDKVVIKVRDYGQWDQYTWARGGRNYSWHETAPLNCDCGAVHTSFPDLHLNWCSNNIEE